MMVMAGGLVGASTMPAGARFADMDHTGSCCADALYLFEPDDKAVQPSFPADADAVNPPESADETYASSTTRSSCNATSPRMRDAMRIAHATCACVSSFSHQNDRSTQVDAFMESPETHANKAFCTYPRPCPAIDHIPITELFRSSRDSLVIQSIRYIQHASCIANDRNA